MGGDVGQRNAFVLDASHTMAVDAVLEIVQAAAEANGQTISHGLVRMLAKLASRRVGARRGCGRWPTRPCANRCSACCPDWQLEDPNPEQYGRVLHYLATSSRDGRASRPAVAADPDPLRIDAR